MFYTYYIKILKNTKEVRCNVLVCAMVALVESIFYTKQTLYYCFIQNEYILKSNKN